MRAGPLFCALISITMAACSGVTFTVPRPGTGQGDSSAAGPGADADTPDERTAARPSQRQAAARDKGGARPKDASGSKEDRAVQAALEKVRADHTAYKIRPGDLLEISVFQEPDLNRKVRVGPDGSITLPLAGKVEVGSMDTQKAEASVAQALQKYLVSPQVTVFVAEYSTSLVYILGEVKAPGSYPIPGETPMTVLEAITLAGGFTQYAAQERTRVIRNAEGKSETLHVDVRQITKGDKSKDMQLKPNDVIFVPESFF
ncbi:MAG: polysaccharide biosynthesis/export family protein [Elusimicrobia bacterium]|nr:polysaccharide biosynthesis/export family protein [Elusimicrobiota bacterium]